MIPPMTARVNVQPRRRGCTVQSDGGVQFTPTTLFSFKRRRCSTRALYSLVDIKMGMGISRAFYKDNVTAFILLSSDSDFWGVISSLPDADFLVMVEEGKCGPDIQNALEQDGTYYCFMDDFCTGNIKSFKNAMFVSALKDEMEQALSIDTRALVDDILKDLRMDVSASEKNNYYNKYIRKMRLEIDEKGMLKIKVQEE